MIGKVRRRREKDANIITICATYSDVSRLGDLEDGALRHRVQREGRRRCLGWVRGHWVKANRHFTFEADIDADSIIGSSPRRSPRGNSEGCVWQRVVDPPIGHPVCP